MRRIASVCATLWTLILIGGCACRHADLPPAGYSAAQPAQHHVHSSSNFPLLKQEIDRIIATELHPHTTAAVKIISLATGETVYETNPDLLLVPASNQKLVTAAAALSLLGPEHALKTSVALDQRTNTIYLKGCGDSLLKQKELAQLAQETAAKLPGKGAYAVSADTACFDEVYWGAGWMWDDEPDPDSMYLSALSLNRNTVTVTVEPGEVESAPLRVTTDPATDTSRY